ncbi:hypothetical protein CC86DRAFT_285578 [Ophiobolus disseminans]|uniref:Uncharacterized protein n=1 Tax=Ophiobolus disseminans TaxID=1469910 RepID=A0A6A7ABI9_9PLEO|nr:hypothetical protein CC86DRAFT_285578 [Ophiobolus disseminans]
MTSLFPHPTYAEDQPRASAILYLHVIRASSMTFAFFSLAQFPFTLLRNSYRKTSTSISTLVARTIQTSGRAFVIGSVVGALATWGRMRGREEIEWQDRAWRILENEGEVNTDWAVLTGATGGALVAAAAARRGAMPVSVGRAMLGGAGAGSSVGIPYMIATFARGRKPA